MAIIDEIEGLNARSGKSSRGPLGEVGGEPDKARRASLVVEGELRPDKPKRRSKSEFREVDHEPLLRRRLVYEQAHLLATLPRKRVDEFTQAAFWAAVAAVTPGIAGLIDIDSATPAQPRMLDIAEIIIFAVCVALGVTGCLRNRGAQLSEDCLRSLYGLPDPVKEKTKWQFWRRQESELDSPSP